MNEFWKTRKTMWPDTFAAQRPMIAPVGDELDHAVAKIMTRRRINGANVAHHAGLADDPWHLELQPIFGRDFWPYREVRSVWVPIAAHFANYEGVAQARRLASLQTGARPIQDMMAALEDAMKSFDDARAYELVRAWGKTPLRRFFQQGLTLKEYFAELQDRFLAIRDTIADIMAFELYHNDLDFHRATDFRGRAFVTVLAMAWARLNNMGRGDRIAVEPFANFVDAARRAAPVTKPAASAIDEILASDIEWHEYTTLSSLLQVTEDIWDEICVAAPFEDAGNKALGSAMFQAIMTPDDMKAEGWHRMQNMQRGASVEVLTALEGKDDHS